MRKILFVSVILTILAACSSERVNFSQLQDRSGMFYLVNSDKPFSGDVASYVNGRIEFEGKIEKGLREATWTYYYPNGQKKMEGNYREGVKDGTWTYWKDNGTQEGLEMYKYGKLLSNEGTVTKEVKPYSLVVGNPARQTGWMSEYGHKLIFDNKGMATCPESKERYRIENGKVSKIIQ